MLTERMNPLQGHIGRISHQLQGQIKVLGQQVQDLFQRWLATTEDLLQAMNEWLCFGADLQPLNKAIFTNDYLHPGNYHFLLGVQDFQVILLLGCLLYTSDAADE